MNNNFMVCLSHVLTAEGYHPNDPRNPFGFVNNPADPGGMTQLGVTKKAWEAYVGHPVTESDMRSLRPDTVAPFYKAKYWDTCHGDTLPAGVDYAVMDFAVNSGPSRAIKFLQEVVGVKADGNLGPMTFEAIGLMTPTQIITDLSDKRLAFLQALPTFATFGLGWSNRVAQVENLAFKMVVR
jgi:lysozyme family protein